MGQKWTANIKAEERKKEHTQQCHRQQSYSLYESALLNHHPILLQVYLFHKESQCSIVVRVSGYDLGDLGSSPQSDMDACWVIRDQSPTLSPIHLVDPF